MADDFGARKCKKYIVVCMLPDFCHGGPLPYPAMIDLSESVSTSPNVNFNGSPVFLYDQSDTVKVEGDTPGVGLGVLSLSIERKCEAITFSTSMRVNGKQQVRENDLFKMNIGNEDEGENPVPNTIGKLMCVEGGAAAITADGMMPEMTDWDPNDESFMAMEEAFAAPEE